MPFEEPEGWEWCTIDDIAESNIGLTYKPSDISNEGVPVYRSNNIQNRSICLDDVVRVDTQILEKQYLHESDLLICARNGSRNLVGKCALIPNLSEPTTFGAFMAVCRSSYNKWIFLLLNSDYFDAYLDDSNSTAINQVTQKMLLAFQMPFPPVNEQDRIYNEVCKWFSVIDILEFEERDLILSIEKAKSKILDLAIHGKLVPQDPSDEPAIELLKRINPSFVPCDNAHYPFDVPNNWTTCQLGDIYNIVSAKRVHKSEWQHCGIPFYRAREIVKLSENGEVDNDLFITKEHYSDLKKKYGVPRPSDIMISAVGTIGKTYIVKADDVFYYKDASVICLQNINDLYSPYISILLSSHFLQEQIFAQSKGTTVDTITIEKANSYMIPFPPIKEQQRIVAKIEELFAVLDEIQKSIEA